MFHCDRQISGPSTGSHLSDPNIMDLGGKGPNGDGEDFDTSGDGGPGDRGTGPSSTGHGGLEAHVPINVTSLKEGV